MMQVWARQVGSSASFEAHSSTGDFAVGAALLMALPSRVDFDGDGRADLGVFRPGNGTWSAALSSTQYRITYPHVGHQHGPTGAR